MGEEGDMMCFENDDNAGKSVAMKGPQKDAVGKEEDIIRKDSRLYRSLEALNEENINVFMNAERNPRTIRYSKEHDNKMRQMIKEQFGSEAAMKMEALQKQRNKAADGDKASKRGFTGFYYLHPRFKKAIAAVLIVFLVTGITMSTEAFRQSIIKLMMDIQKDFIGIAVDDTISEVDESDEGAETIEKVYALGKIQQGYQLFSENKNSHMIVRQYKNTSQSTYKFVQLPQGTIFYHDNEKTEKEAIETIFGEMVFYDGYDIDYLIWFYDGYKFEIAGDLAQEDMIALAESLVLETKKE